MTGIHVLEESRRTYQVELDSLKTAAERNILGQFATPNNLAVEIMEHLKSSFGVRKRITFLEPALGTGSFYSALIQVFGHKDVKSAVGVEIDSGFANRAQELWDNHELRVIESDFTSLEPTERFNLLVTNPPYVRHHHLTSDDKKRLTQYAVKRFGMNVSGLSGLYCHFIYKSHDWLADDAISVWLIPSEFMDVNYGEALKRYLTSFVTLEQIHRFNPEDVQFTDALVSSAVVIFRNRPVTSGHEVKMTFGGTLANPAIVESVPVETLRHSRKWTRYPHREDTVVHLDGALTLGDLFTVKRGLVTGSNKFFIKERSEALALGIPAKFLKPILPSPRNLQQSTVEADSDGFPKLDTQLVMIDCSLPSTELQSKYPDFWKYLESGIEQGINAGYLANSRKPWYSQENRPGAMFLCTYMGRAKAKGTPFRFILNKSKATATNVYLMLYPKPQLAKAIESHPELALIILERLNAVGASSFFAEGRVYGGGLHKMEPKELMRIPLAEDLLEYVEVPRLF